MDKSLQRIRWVGMLEGASFLVLLGIAMPLKYGLGMPVGVRVVGPIHGVLFMAYVAMALQGTLEGWLTRAQCVRMVVASLLPFGPFVVDRELKKLAASPVTETVES